MNISIGFVIYLPEKSILDRIKTTTESGYMVYIYDNSPKIGFVRDFCKKLTNCLNPVDKTLKSGLNYNLNILINSFLYYDN